METLLMGSNAPFRGCKAQLYEGGIHTPCIVRWHEVLPANQRMNHPVHMVDWMPTFSALLDVRPQADPAWDGQNIWPLLSGQPALPPSRPLYWNLLHQRFAVRYADWKLIVQEGRRELYNLAADPGEVCDRAAGEADVVNDLQRILDEQRARDNSAVRPGLA
jgi:arylsulfatase A-like enzyme